MLSKDCSKLILVQRVQVSCTSVWNCTFTMSGPRFSAISTSRSRNLAKSFSSSRVYFQRLYDKKTSLRASNKDEIKRRVCSQTETRDWKSWFASIYFLITLKRFWQPGLQVLQRIVRRQRSQVRQVITKMLITYPLVSQYKNSLSLTDRSGRRFADTCCCECSWKVKVSSNCLGEWKICV